MIRNKRRLLSGVGVAALSGLAIVAGVALAPSLFPAETTGTGVDSLDILPVDPQDLVAVSDVIFVGTYRSERTEVVRDRGSVTVADINETVRHEDNIRVFQVEQIIRGNQVSVGSTVEGRWTTKVWFPKSEVGTSDPVQTYLDDVNLVPGKSYVVFLAELRDEDGNPYFGSYGSSDIAAITDGRLSFVAARGYLDKLARHGSPRALPPAFSGLTLDDLVKLVARSDSERAEAAQRPTPGIQLTALEMRLQEFLEGLPSLATAADIEAAAARLQLGGPVPPDAALCMKLEGFVRQTRGLETDFRCTAP